MENAVNPSTAGSGGQIVVAGAGYAGLHVTLRLTAKLRNNPEMKLTLVDRHDYHQVLTELPRVAGGTRAADAVRIPLQDVLADRVRFVQTQINGFDLPARRLLTAGGPIGWTRLVLALGSRPRYCPRWPAPTAWRTTGPPCSLSRRAPSFWPAPHRS